MRGAVHHIDLTVKGAHASRAFYESMLGFMGYRYTAPISDIPAAPHNGYDFDLRDGDDFCSIGILSARGENAGREHDRHSPGLHHIAWNAASREDVDAMHQHLISIGATILNPPAAYPKYGPTYYAVFFADPDGLKLEYVHKP
ncbi:VOC family protein [Terricaulis silvestris]|uniref:Putative lactoylglutathione lyase n=1 Tax=Terricaulis silvestris TaxID=2686094 RepID=A0A6I6MHJ0_9CAUL|nr:VOC family protein [Terricaulis silvestris]QGZ94375.1 putative lactoylglutathione lyase [Terricaulis silvestris]